MALAWISPAAVEDAEGVAAVTPNPAAGAVLINGATPILAGSVVTPHGSHVAPLTIDPTTCSTNVFINGVGVATVSSKSTCGAGIQSTGTPPTPKTASSTVNIG